MDAALSAAVSAGLILLSYLLGSIPFAVVVSRLMGLKDPRSYGSGNPGATNVLRTGNKKAAVFTLIGDAAKGWVAVFAAGLLAARMGLPTGVVAACGVAVFIGHAYSIFLKFKGGKGVATALGVLLGLEPWLALVVAANWLLVAYVSRYSSLAAILSAILAPVYYMLGAKTAWPLHMSYAFGILVIAIVLLFRHQQNISRLLQGKESRIGNKNKTAAPEAGTGRKRR